MFRLALETDDAGAVNRVVFLALRGEEGHVQCFWPVPLEVEPTLPVQGQLAARLYNVSQPTVSRIVAQHRSALPPAGHATN